MSRYLIASVIVLAVASVWYVFSVPDFPPFDVYSQKSVLVGDTERRFTLVVPRDLPLEPPILFAFHGTGDTAETMANYSQLNRLAAEHQFILVYPAASGSSWDTHSRANDSTNADQQFFDQLLRVLTEQYSPNSRRVCAVGMSNGGTFSLLLASTRTAQLAAVVAHSSIPPHFDSPPEHRSPTMLIVGDSDPAFDTISTFAVRMKLPCITVPGLAHEWSTAHNSDVWRFLSKHEAQSH